MSSVRDATHIKRQQLKVMPPVWYPFHVREIFAASLATYFWLRKLA